ncbi:hypothetical protein JTB14_012340 [Gonioctena quinquepunctata]|nr:hypothetical protein JTB14_012340 [Gonioctena quinquepunctata]
MSTTPKNTGAQEGPKMKTRKSAPSLMMTQAGKNFPPSLDEAIQKFKAICQNYEWKKMPIPIFYDEKYPQSFSDDEPRVLLSLSHKKHHDDIDKVSFSRRTIETNTITVLFEWQNLYKSISVLKLENCNLTADQVELLADLISSYRSVRDLSVNGNPNEKQNFNLLLKDTKLMALSLKFCGIGVEGIRKISGELCTPLGNDLLHLNLASNDLMNEGVEYLAKILRINRMLISLNLADNKIRKEGCATLMKPLQKFSLTHDEIVIRRRIKFKLQKKSLSDIARAKDASKCNILRRTPSKISKKSSKEKTSASSQSMRSKKSSTYKLDSEMIYHPFVQDSEETDTEIYCTGNDILTNLNLSYNRIRRGALQSVIDMLEYQRNNYANERGISRISFEGNDVNGLGEIEDFLAAKQVHGNVSMISTRTRSQSVTLQAVSQSGEMSGHNLHKVFVYGTLKKGEPNHSWFSKSTVGYYRYLSDARTVEKYPLIIATKYNIPFILQSPGNGTQVRGELYEVGDTVLADLDILEDHPNFYIRELHDVAPLNDQNSTVKAWIYMVKNFKKDLLNEPFFESYKSAGSHGKKYVESEESTLEDLNSR